MDPDARLVQASTRSIGRSVALLSAAMVLAGAALLFGALWWKSTFKKAPDPGTHYLFVAIDPVDLGIAGLIIGLGAVILAGVAATFFARRATAPLIDALRRQRNFVADASHELRTPLAVLDARIQHVAALTRSDERVSPVVAELRQDSRQLVEIVDDLLQLATIQPLSGTASLGSTALGPTIEQVAGEQAVIAEQRDVSLSVEAIEATVLVPETALHRLLTALIDNAINHTPAGGSVSVVASVASRFATVRVSDTGPGIQGISPDRVFERFAQGTGGHRESHGIGLALVRDTITRCGGSVAVTRSDNTGTEFTLTLPLVGGK